MASLASVVEKLLDEHAQLGVTVTTLDAKGVATFTSGTVTEIAPAPPRERASAWLTKLITYVSNETPQPVAPHQGPHFTLTPFGTSADPQSTVSAIGFSATDESVELNISNVGELLPPGQRLESLIFPWVAAQQVASESGGGTVALIQSTAAVISPLTGAEAMISVAINGVPVDND